MKSCKRWNRIIGIHQILIYHSIALAYRYGIYELHIHFHRSSIVGPPGSKRKHIRPFVHIMWVIIENASVFVTAINAKTFRMFQNQKKKKNGVSGIHAKLKTRKIISRSRETKKGSVSNLFHWFVPPMIVWRRRRLLTKGLTPYRKQFVSHLEWRKKKSVQNLPKNQKNWIVFGKKKKKKTFKKKDTRSTATTLNYSYSHDGISIISI